MTMDRMDRVHFFQKLAGLDDQSLKKALWNLYWRGSAAMRERIEAELDPTQAHRKMKAADESVDPERIRTEVSDFVKLARSGAYIAGDRRVSPRERTRWRFTFKRLVTDVERALRIEDNTAGIDAMEQLIDLACQMRDLDYFRSEDPVEAAGFVVSDKAALLWSRVRRQWGFSEFAKRAAVQLLRWESRYGWTRVGMGQTSEKETSLASVLAQMLSAPDMWTQFADRYLDALDQAVASGGSRTKNPWHGDSSNRSDRAGVLAEWHLLLLDKLIDSAAEDRLDKLVRHPALAGPELWFLQAQVSQRRGDVDGARRLVEKSLKKFPGHTEFLSFAADLAKPATTPAP